MLPNVEFLRENLALQARLAITGQIKESEGMEERVSQNPKIFRSVKSQKAYLIKECQIRNASDVVDVALPQG